MELNDDPQLRELLREWKAPDAPALLDQRVLRSRTSWWRFLFAGSIRVPVPLAAGLVIAMIALALFLFREKLAVAPGPTIVNLQNFQPVKKVNVRILRSEYAIQ
jgi:hypothetical protein